MEGRIPWLWLVLSYKFCVECASWYYLLHLPGLSIYLSICLSILTCFCLLFYLFSESFLYFIVDFSHLGYSYRGIAVIYIYIYICPCCDGTWSFLRYSKIICTVPQSKCYFAILTLILTQFHNDLGRFDQQSGWIINRLTALKRMLLSFTGEPLHLDAGR